jgi:hypothetical protein
MENKKNLLYFEGSSMKELYENMEKWQHENQKRLLSLSIEREDNIYCCIGLSNPTEVTIVDRHGKSCHDHEGSLYVYNVHY